jgi:hypothetical protein
MTDRELLAALEKHLDLLQRLALSRGPIRCGGLIVGKYQTIGLECQAARDKIREHLAND